MIRFCTALLVRVVLFGTLAGLLCQFPVAYFGVIGLGICSQVKWVLDSSDTT